SDGGVMVSSKGLGAIGEDSIYDVLEGVEGVFVSAVKVGQQRGDAACLVTKRWVHLSHKGRFPVYHTIGGSISLEGFLLPIQLLVMIMVMVVIVAVILVVVVVVIVGVVIVVTIIMVVVVVMIIENCALLPDPLISGLCCKIRLPFFDFSSRIILIGQEPFQFSPCNLVGLLYSNRFCIGIPPGQGILGESTSSKFHFVVLDTVATRKYRFSLFKLMNETNSSFCTIEVERLAAHKLIDTMEILEFKTSKDRYGDNIMRDPIGGLVSLVDLTGDEDPIDEDGDTKVGDSEVLVSLGEISSGGRKSRESSIGDTEDGGKAVGENTSVTKRYLVKSSEELGELFPDDSSYDVLEGVEGVFVAAAVVGQQGANVACLVTKRRKGCASDVVADKDDATPKNVREPDDDEYIRFDVILGFPVDHHSSINIGCGGLDLCFIF
nr:hypothetical protein [Tanacetum cinerariifolium]